ncbi:hypothetical protein [Saccharospirillum mangrovi]|uniref:hypothetical protein n=1 Tax=Saccharospirillum mangrovi TaxID=2161747 RepID=UPI000D38A78C|nr:hypothetical protein [Saccharospirillum mangrovi]
MASESIVDQYIDSLFVFDFSDPQQATVFASTIERSQAMVPTFKTPNQVGQFMLMAQQLLSIATQLPESNLRQHCLNTGFTALRSCQPMATETPNLNDLLRLDALVR